MLVGAPPSCWGVRCCCLAPPLVGRAVSACSCFGSWCCSQLDARLVSLVRCCLRRRTAGVVGCCLSVVFAWPGLVLCCCVPPPLMGRAALVCGPLHGGACCVGAWAPLAGACCVVARLPRWWCLVWVVIVCWLGCGCGCVVGLAGVGAVLVRAPPPLLGRAVFARGPPLWGVLCRRVRVSVCGVVTGWMSGSLCWFAVVSAAVQPALSGVGCLWCLPGRGWCCVGACPPPVFFAFLHCASPQSPPPVGACRACACPPPLVGRAVSVCSGSGSSCCCWLDARLVLLVCCRFCRSTTGVVGCWWFVVFSWPGQTGRPPERVWCATSLSWLGQTGRPPERVRCATPCFCLAGVVALPHVFPCSLVSVRFLALRWCFSPPAAVPPSPPHPTLPFRLLSSAYPFASWCPAPAGGCAPPPPPPGVVPFAAAGVRVYPCCRCAVRLLCAAWPFIGASCCPPPPPTPPGLCFLALSPCRSFSLASCCCLVFSVPLALGPFWVGFFVPPQLALVPPPPGGYSWLCAGPPCLVLWCCGWVWAVLCGCLAVWCARRLCRWPSLVGVGHARSVGVARCTASPCCFVRFFAVCGAVARCRVLWCFPCCCVVSWLFSLCLLGPAHLQVAPPGATPPPLRWFVCRAFCRFVLAHCAGLFCPLSHRVAACCVVLFGMRRAVSCPVVLCGWRGAALLPLVRLRLAACSVLCCRALRRLLGCCLLVLCAVLSRCVLLWVAFCCLVSVGVVRLAACCAALLFPAVCCAALLGVVSGCAVLCCPRCGLLFRFGRAALCCAMPPGAVLGRVASCCAVWCCAAVHCAVGVARCCVVSRSVVPLPAVACPRVLRGASRDLCFAVCCAVLLCFVLCLGVWCLGALCSAVCIVSCCLVRVCVPVWCAVSLGAVVLCVASCCFVRCSAVAHCAVCVVLCCFCSRFSFLVLLRVMPCPRV